MRKVFLDELPRFRFGKGQPNGVIDWYRSIGMKVKFIYDNIEGWIEIVGYDGKDLHIKYKDEEILKMFTSDFKKCQIGKLLNIRNGEFKIKMNSNFKDNRRNLVIIDREYRKFIRKDDNVENQKWYKYKCNKCGYEGWVIEGSLIKGTGCACCHGFAVVEGFNDILTTAPWMVKYFQNPEDAKLYTRTSNKKVKVKCPDCGRIKDKSIAIHSIYTGHSIGCSCSDGQSYPNKFMFNVLEQLEVNFETEYSSEWCKYELKNKVKQGRYDFYLELNNNKYIVEMDGGLHKEDNNMNGQTKEESKEIDVLKDQLAEKHDIEVIRIDCYESELEYIKDKIFNSRLMELFDLSNIDWLKVEEFALSNRVKEACEIKRNNPKLNTKEIGQIMKLTRSTITTYLKKGTKLGWCEYDAKDEMIKNGKSNNKKIEIFDKYGISKGIFESISELTRQSEDLFGVKLSVGAISVTCKGKYSHYKGFTFKYV